MVTTPCGPNGGHEIFGTLGSEPGCFPSRIRKVTKGMRESLQYGEARRCRRVANEHFLEVWGLQDDYEKRVA